MSEKKTLLNLSRPLQTVFKAPVRVRETGVNGNEDMALTRGSGLVFQLVQFRCSAIESIRVMNMANRILEAADDQTDSLEISQEDHVWLKSIIEKNPANLAAYELAQIYLTLEE